MKHVSLFSGIGGIDLAAEWAGFETVLQVEIDDYAIKVLEKHWPDVKRIRDIHDVKKESVDGAITLISGGFPCTPFSIAGKRRGKKDDRFLWSEMFRVIRKIKPTWVLAENVLGLFSIESGMVIENMFTDLENAGYETFPPLIIPAAGVGAPHKRQRIFIVANAKEQNKRRLSERKKEKKSRPISDGQNICNTTSQGLQNGITATLGTSKEGLKKLQSQRSDWWAVEPCVGRMASRIPKRVDRLKCLGNAVVPQQVYPILQAIAVVETRSDA